MFTKYFNNYGDIYKRYFSFVKREIKFRLQNPLHSLFQDWDYSTRNLQNIMIKGFDNYYKLWSLINIPQEKKKKKDMMFMMP